MKYYPSIWEESSDYENLSGIATFTVEGSTYTYRLQSFEDYQNICGMLQIVYLAGKDSATKNIVDDLFDALDSVEKAMKL
jgi:hypothetical protein